MSFPSQVRTIDDLQGLAGRLEAILNTGAPDAPYTALLAHPAPALRWNHAQQSGLPRYEGLYPSGNPTLRFNFRGTGLSEGTHDEGRGEVDDVLSALDYLHRLHPGPVIFCGFSFGSNVGLRACCGDPRVAGLIGLGLPVRAAGRDYRYDFLPGCSAPKLFLSGSDDEFCPPEILADILQLAPTNQHTVIIPGADHFFQGTPASPKPKLDQMQNALTEWLTSTFALKAPE